MSKAQIWPINLETVRCKSTVLIANRKSHIGVRLVTLNDLERHSGRYFVSFYRFVALGAIAVTSKWLKIDPYCLQQKCSFKKFSFSSAWLMGIFTESSWLLQFCTGWSAMVNQHCNVYKMQLLDGWWNCRHVGPRTIREQLHWLPVVHRIKFSVMLLVYMAHNRLCRLYINEVLTPISIVPISSSATTFFSQQQFHNSKKHKTAVFRVKLHSTRRKSATKFLCVNTIRDKVVRHPLAYLSVQKSSSSSSSSTNFIATQVLQKLQGR